jgi:antitoxin component of RelBE/YafQ-DinJ toxin-antitoxin module
MKKRINISVDEEVFQKFKEYCDERGMKVSTKIQRMMEEEMEK